MLAYKKLPHTASTTSELRRTVTSKMALKGEATVRLYKLEFKLSRLSAVRFLNDLGKLEAQAELLMPKDKLLRLSQSTLAMKRFNEHRY